MTDKEIILKFTGMVVKEIVDIYTKYYLYCTNNSILVRPKDHLFSDCAGGKQFAVAYKVEDGTAPADHPYVFLVVCSDYGYGGAEITNKEERKGKMVFVIHLYQGFVKFYATPSWTDMDGFVTKVAASLSLETIKNIKQFKDILRKKVDAFISEQQRKRNEFLRAHKDTITEFATAIMYSEI